MHLSFVVRLIPRALPLFAGAALAFSLTAAPGCTPSRPVDGAGPPANTASVVVTAAHRAEATEIFVNRCTPCHGETGAGDGAASKQLNPPPRALNNPEWQQKTDDNHIDKIIQYGGAAVGLSPAMPSNPDLGGKPAVIKALREHIRTLAKAP